MGERFRPNAVMATMAALEELEPWQQLVMACHFAPKMRDCVELDYRYELNEDGQIDCYSADGEFLATLEDDCNPKEPLRTLNQYYDLSDMVCVLALKQMLRMAAFSWYPVLFRHMEFA